MENNKPYQKLKLQVSTDNTNKYQNTSQNLYDINQCMYNTKLERITGKQPKNSILPLKFENNSSPERDRFHLDNKYRL